MMDQEIPQSPLLGFLQLQLPLYEIQMNSYEFQRQQEGPIDTTMLHLDIPHTAEFGVQPPAGD